MKRICRCIVLALLTASLTPAVRAQFFTTDTTIGPSDTNYDGQDIVVFGCTLTVDGSHTFSDVLLADGAVLTHSPCTNGLYDSVPGGLNLVVQNNLVVDETSAIHADGLNALGIGNGVKTNASLPFGTPEFYTSGSGGGHGGLGGPSLGGSLGGTAYGDPVTTTNEQFFGSGGGAGDGPGGLGGGSIIIVVDGAILLDGTITANGGAGTNSGSGGGSGGGIRLSADSILGSGSIVANGGSGDPLAGGGGGGGRIALTCLTNGLTGARSAYGGEGYLGGGAGTVFLSESNTIPSLLIDNGGLDGTNTPLAALSTAPNLLITNGAIAAAISTGGNFALVNLVIGPGSALLGYTNLSTLQVFVRGSANIASGAGIMADNSAYAGNYPGASETFGEITSGGGGGNGGYGGSAASGAVGGGSDVNQGLLSVAFPGSPGGRGFASYANSVGGFGGGAIILSVIGELTLNGSLTANGGEGLALGSGGGSGGDIMVSAGIFNGVGLISADGGAGESSIGGGGGGGRITITCPTNQFAGTVTAFGGPGFVAGGAGTILERTRIGDAGEVTIDNGGLIGTNTPLPQVNAGGLSLLHGARLAVIYNLMPTNLFVGSNCFIIPGIAPAPVSSVALTVQPGPLTVEAGGVISADGKSIYAPGDGGTGCDVLVNGIVSGGGGGSAGYGGASAFGALGGGVYGEVNGPANGGGGGEGLAFGFGGNPGGQIHITVQGNLVLNGRLSANGNPGVVEGSGGGAGGYITIQARSITGSGVVSVNGGAGSAPYGGGGGGGRIAINTVSNLFLGTMTAYGGAGANSGGAGTILLQSGQSSNALVIANGGRLGTNTPLTGLPVNCSVTISNGAIATLGGEVALQSLFIGANSYIAGVSSAFQEVNSFLVEKSATIEAGGGIILDGLGYTSGEGPGAGRSSEFQKSGLTAGGGGGHGGFGGSAISTPGGTAYDSIAQPAQMGSGGGPGTGITNQGGAGGGLILISVEGLLTVNGVISANGNPATNLAAGGGSGGSIFLNAGGLAGAGLIAANGGSGQLPYGGGGGGGLVTIGAHSNLFTGVVTAHGGPGFVAGGAGAVFTYSSRQFTTNPEQLIIDNGGLRGTNTPLSGPIGPLIVVATYDLQVSGGAVVQPGKGVTGLIVNNLLVASNSMITQTAGQNLSVDAQLNALISPGGAICVDGAGYAGAAGAGAGGWSKAGQCGGGGGYGGAGGAGAYGAAGGLPYGTSNSPSSFGSGGGLPVPNTGLSQGGGLVTVSSKGVLTIDGVVSANGVSARLPGAGGGAGGTVTVSAETLAGNGVISASGGAGDLELGGGGGGGRIVIDAPSNTFAGTVAVLGGAGLNAGQNGTVFISTAPPAISNLVPAPELTTELDFSHGKLNLFWTGSSDLTYQVQVSTNLADWLPYGRAVNGTNGAMSFSASCDTEAQFFRVVSSTQ